ncbi:hypothetical protein [Lactobacillus sp. ESL0246]|uniref:hypothetical protein n=1 Tax=Lactobacillus sp. ESL0246 TaxID=2069359 RepID=UPI0011C3F8A5|nr:hypothetical protein [Lactobacillus sp. ESL0246]
MKEHNLLARKYNLRAGKYGFIKRSSSQKGQESLPPKVYNQSASWTYLPSIESGNEHQYF